MYNHQQDLAGWRTHLLYSILKKPYRAVGILRERFPMRLHTSGLAMQSPNQIGTTSGCRKGLPPISEPCFLNMRTGRRISASGWKNSRQRILKSKSVQIAPLLTRKKKDLFKLLNSNNYPKGGWVLHMLRGILGDELFFKGIKAYYSQFTHQAVLTDDFQRSMEAVSGRSLDWFFDQWTLQPGFPQLSYEENWQAKIRNKGYLNSYNLANAKKGVAHFQDSNGSLLVR